MIEARQIGEKRVKKVRRQPTPSQADFAAMSNQQKSRWSRARPEVFTYVKLNGKDVVSPCPLCSKPQKNLARHLKHVHGRQKRNSGQQEKAAEVTERLLNAALAKLGKQAEAEVVEQEKPELVGS